MADLFATGRIIDIILALVVLECVAVVAAYRLGLAGVRPRALLPTLASGLLLLLALRAAIADAGWILIAAPLTLALVAHVIDLAERWREQRQNQPPRTRKGSL
jgi:hypothetical protein